MESNIKLKKKPMKFEEMSKDQIRQAILRKKECNANAQKIVESLLEEGVTEDYMLQCLPDINQAHFDDIFEERAILQLCGYPICHHTISYKDMPKQKYRISLKTNKVYDITARKNFCSNSCYKSAMYVKQQMLTSPLWFREHEEIPHFHLLPLHTPGSIGQEVDLGIIDRVKIKDEKFVSINDFTSANLKDIKDDEYDLQLEPDTNRDNDKELKETEPPENSKKDQNANNPIQEKDTKQVSNETIQLQANVCTDKSTNKEDKPKPNPTNIVGEIIEKAERKIDPILTQETIKNNNKPKKMPQKKQPSVTTLAIDVEKCLAQWFTLDTILFLFGEEKVREMVANKGESISAYLKNYTKGIFYNSNAYDQYQQLCKKLNMLEIEDKRSSKTMQRQMQPLPDYSILQEESKRMQLKVKAFLTGETEIPDPEQSEKDKQTEEDVQVTQLPLVDKNAQNALRRRIVCQYLNKVLPDLLRSLGLQGLTTSSDVRLLVSTFKLKANNIMFKPIQWTLIALIFIKLLSIRDKRLEYLLKQSMAFQHLQLLLLSFKLDGSYLDKLVAWLTDIDRLLDTNDTQLTLE